MPPATCLSAPQCLSIGPAYAAIAADRPDAGAAAAVAISVRQALQTGRKDERVGVTSGLTSVTFGVSNAFGAATGGGEDSPYRNASSSSMSILALCSLTRSCHDRQTLQVCSAKSRD